MTTITTAQARKRFTLLPQELQNSIFSFGNAEIIDKIGIDNHLSEEKTEVVANAVSLVLFGFIHQEDLAAEIQEQAGIPKEAALAVAGEADEKIFNAIKDVIKEAYAPATEEEMGATAEKPLKTANSGGPMMIEEIPMTAMPGAATAASQKPAPAPKFPIKNLTVEMPGATPSAVPAPAPIPTMPKIAPQIFAGNPQIQASLPLSKTPEKKPETPTPKPVILQEAAAFETNKKSAEFHIETSEDKFQGLSNIPRPMPQKAAVLEFGSSSKTPVSGSVPSKNSRPSQDFGGQAEARAGMPPKPVTGKYEGEFNEFPSGPAPVTEKGRTITEITSSFQASSKNPRPSQDFGGQAEKNKNQSSGGNSVTPAAPMPPASEISTPSKISTGSAEIKNFGGIPPMPQHPRIQEKDLMGEFAAPAQIPTEKPADKTVPAPAPFMINAIPAPAPQSSSPIPPPPLPVFGKNILPSQNSRFAEAPGVAQGGGQAGKSVSDVTKFTAEKPARGIVPPPSFAMPAPAPRPSFFSKIFKKELAKPAVVIQKNYSEADTVPKISSPSQADPKNTGPQAVSTSPTNPQKTPSPASLPDIPVPPKKN